MKPSPMRRSVVLAAFIAALCSANAFSQGSGWRLKAGEGGGFVVEPKAGAVADIAATGLAAAGDLLPLLQSAYAGADGVDFSQGEKLDGAYTVTVARDDGTLARFDGAENIIVFARPRTLSTVGGVTSLSGVIVFTLKIDNFGKGRAVQRLDEGDITLTLPEKSV